MRFKIKIKSIFCLFLAIMLVFHFFFNSNLIILRSRINYPEKIQNAGQNPYTKQWLKNNDFSSSNSWFLLKGDQGDNSTVNGTISGGYANYKIIGDNNTYELLTGDINSSSWVGWNNYSNGDYLQPDVVEINATGLFAYHSFDENRDGGAGQVYNFPSVHFKKNISLQHNMSNYEITSASLKVFFNATVDRNVDVYGDPVGQPSDPDDGIFDSATFYTAITDINNSYLFRVAENKTTNLGQDSGPQITNITDRELTYINETDLITALNLALEKDPSNTDFTIVLGIDIYCEDNNFPDFDLWKSLIFKSLNLTFTYEKKVEKFSSVSWNQEGDTIPIVNTTITEATLEFKVNISQKFPSNLSSFSEMSFKFNNDFHTETLRLSSLNTTFDTISIDVTDFIIKGENITLAIQIFISNTFSLGKNITISIDDVYLTISYYETFPDYSTNKLDLFLDKVDKTAEKYIQIPFNNTLNVTIRYTNQSNGFHIPNATVEIVEGLSLNLTENKALEQYTMILNRSHLSVGIKSLRIEARQTNYTTQSIDFFVEVLERATIFNISVEGNPINDSITINTEVNKIINVTAIYIDNSSEEFLSSATVEILGGDQFSEGSSYYNMSINTNDLNEGINVIIINAKLSNYTSQSFQFFINLIAGSSELLLYVNGDPIYDSDTISVQTNVVMNIVVYYRNSITKNLLNNASVELLGINNFTEDANYYVYTINSNNLNLGITILTITAEANNYQSRSIQFSVEVIERTAEIQLILNNENKTLDPVIELPLGSTLNITVKFTENQTNLHISNAILSLTGYNFSIILSENQTLEHYSFIVNTTDLKTGVNLLTLTAQSANYKIEIRELRITIKKINTIISTVSGEPVITINPGESVELRILINNSDFDIAIKNANVSYRWIYGRGDLTDYDNDGIYESDIENIPEGTYTITITASAGDNYNFESYEITLSAVKKPKSDQTWLIYTLTAGIVGLVSVFTLYQTHYKYPPMVRKIRKLRKKIRKGKRPKKMILTSKRSKIIENNIKEKTQIIGLESKTSYKEIDKLKDVKEIKEIDKLKEVKEIKDLKEDKEINDLKEDKEINDLKEDKEINELKKKDLKK
ncbi:MAG: hypothetical protein HeimC3_40270 [Candidatus Heimdallarchaeota archaeon LC_3]|nr:MAG: hypothetical protein HeimC3_40270 [Candidatus Heimdallarchaeota archaeon LC_3]